MRILGAIVRTIVALFVLVLIVAGVTALNLGMDWLAANFPAAIWAIGVAILVVLLVVAALIGNAIVDGVVDWFRRTFRSR